MKILIEGTDYSGKSSIAHLLKKQIDYELDENCTYFHNPRGKTDKSREFYESIKIESDQNIKSCKMLLSHAYNQKEVDKIAKTNHIVVDRSIFSFYAYQMNHLSEEELNKLLFEYFSFDSFTFDAAVCLTVNEQEALRRAEKRKDSLDNYFLDHFKRIRSTFVDNFEQTELIDSPVKFCYDTSNESVDEVFNGIRRRIGL